MIRTRLVLTLDRAILVIPAIN